MNQEKKTARELKQLPVISKTIPKLSSLAKRNVPNNLKRGDQEAKLPNLHCPIKEKKEEKTRK